MRVRDIMTKEVFTLRSDHRLDLADDMMKWQRIRHIPIVDKHGLIMGLVTHRDLLKASVSSFAKISREEQRELYQHITAGQIMHPDVMTTTPETDIREAAATMIDEKIGCLPVVEGRKLVGIVTEADFLTLAWELPGRRPSAAPYRARKETGGTKKKVERTVTPRP